MTALLTRRPAATRAFVPVALVIITALCWGYLFLLSARMGEMNSPMAMPMSSAWTGADAALMVSMWAVMMAGMMLPSAAPMITAYAATIRSGNPQMTGSTPVFVTGYLVAWGGFAAFATGAQWLLHDIALINAMGVSTTRWLGGLLLVGAGLYQFTSVKEACLSKCRSPLGFLLNDWRNDRGGALVMGLHHGSICIGCCWALMALLFVLGVMNLWWIALVAAVVLLEKVVSTDAFAKVLGVGLSIWGIAMVASTI